MNTCSCEKCASVRFSAHVFTYKAHLDELRLKEFYSVLGKEFKKIGAW